MIIRRYQDSDFDQMMQLQRDTLIRENVYRGDGFWEEDLKDIEEYYFNDNGYFLVGVELERIISMGAIRKINEHTTELVRMRVHPDFQGVGIGFKILLELEKIAVSKNYKEIILETDERLNSAIKLYLRNGYSFWKEEDINGCMCVWYKKQL